MIFEGDDQTLETYLAGWLQDIDGTIKQRTLENYAYVVNMHITPGLGKIKLKYLKPEKVRALIRDKRGSGLSSRTVQLIHTVLGKALKDAVRDEILHRNVAAAVKPPKRTKKDMHPLTPDQARLIPRRRPRRQTPRPLRRGGNCRATPGRAAGAPVGGCRSRRG